MSHYFGYLETEAGTEIAERFMAAAHDVFVSLAATPGLGVKIESRRNDLSAMRKWRVDGFAAMLIFYMPDGDGISIVRVLHGAQDWWSLLDVD